MALSQREAARAWGVSRATIQRAIAAGELSMTGDRLIDPAEMVRVYGEPRRHTEPGQSRPTGPAEATPEPPQPDPAQTARIAALEAALAAREREVELLSANLADLRSQVRLLTHDGAPRRRWWPFR